MMHYATKVIEDIEKIRKMNYAQVKYTYRDFSIPIEPSVVEDGMSVWVQIKPGPLGLRFPSKVSIKYHEIDNAIISYIEDDGKATMLSLYPDKTVELVDGHISADVEKLLLKRKFKIKAKQSSHYNF